MSTRLTNDLKDKIVANALVKAGVVAAKATYAVKRHQWAEDARAQINGISDVEIKKVQASIQKLVNGIPKNVRGYVVDAANRAHYMYLNLAGASITEYFFALDGKKDYRYVPATRVSILADDPLVQRFYDLEAEKKELADREKGVEANVRALLNSVTTVKRLLLVWPEAVELLPLPETKAKSTLPSIIVADLNAAIGLPSDTQEAVAA